MTVCVVDMSMACQNCATARRSRWSNHHGRRHDAMARVPAEHGTRRSREPAASGQLLDTDPLAADGAGAFATSGSAAVVPSSGHLLGVWIWLETWSLSRYVHTAA